MERNRHPTSRLLLFGLLVLVVGRGCSCSEDTAPPPKQPPAEGDGRDNTSKNEQTEKRDAKPTSTESRPMEPKKEPDQGSEEAARSRAVPAAERKSDRSSGDTESGPSGAGLQKARQTAATAMADAERTANAGNYGRAYEQALSGWEAVQGYADSDPDSRQLAESLMARLKQYGESANRNAPAAPGNSKPLITR